MVIHFSEIDVVILYSDLTVPKGKSQTVSKSPDRFVPLGLLYIYHIVAFNRRLYGMGLAN